MQLGKLASRGLVNAVSPGQLVYIVDQLSRRRFLVDTGAAFSVFPHSSASPPLGPALAGAAGQSIPCWGEQQFQLLLNGTSFTWHFLLAAVQFPIIGVDFLRHFGLLVDPVGNRLVDRLTLQAFQGSSPASVGVSSGDLTPPASVMVHRPLHTDLVPGDLASTATCGKQVCSSGISRVKAPSGSRGMPLEAASQCAVPVGTSGWVASLLAEFPDVVNADGHLPDLVHDVQHHIKTSGPPVASRFRRLEGTKLEAARAEFEAMERDGIVQRSTSPWASPLHMVPKKDGTWRPCGDFRRLNLVTEADVYPLPNMLDLSDRLSGCTVFSKIDLRKGYWQVPVWPEDRPKTAVITPFGLFEFYACPLASAMLAAVFSG